MYIATTHAYNERNSQCKSADRAVFVDGDLICEITASEYESLEETASILNDPTAMRSLKSGIAELDKGQGIPWEQVEAELGL